METIAFLFSILALSGPPAADVDTSYERLLQDENITVSAEGIREYFRSLKRQEVSPQRIAELIRQLGDQSFQKREAASRTLGELPSLPVEELKKAADGPDAEIRYRAKELLSGKRYAQPPITYAVLRMIQIKQIKGLTADLLAILPLIEKHHLEVAARRALQATTRAEDEEILKQHLQSDDPKVRKTAAVMLEVLANGHSLENTADDFLYQGLVAYLPFDGDSSDVGRFGNHGVIEGNVQYVKNGIGRSVRFPGTTNPGFVRIPNSKSLQFSESMTISCWYRMKNGAGFSDDGRQIAVNSAHQAIVSQGGDRKGVALLSLGSETEKSVGGEAFYDRELCFIHQNFKPESVKLLFPPGRTSKRWMHVAAVMGKSGASLYYNGKRVADLEKTVDLTIGSQEPVYVGIMQARDRWWFPIDGYVDELRIYDHGLKSSVIQKIYKHDLEESTDVEALRKFGSVNIQHVADEGVTLAVSLKNSSVSDESLESITRFERLISLDLSGTEITDAGIQHLLALQQIGQINLSKTRVSQEGLKKLREVFPDCSIQR